MNLKRTLFTGLAAAGLMASFAAPMTSAQVSDSNTTNNSATATVGVLVDGTFDVYFAPGTTIDMGTKTLNSQNPQATATGQLLVNYTDTMQQRPAFTVSLSAGDFQRWAGDTGISASGFRVTHTGNVAQYQWDNHNINDVDHGDSTVVPVVGDIGDIGFMVNGVNPGNQNANLNNVWNDTTNLSGLGTPIQFGYAGIGTVWSNGAVDVDLEIPNGTAQGNYSSTLTLSVTFTQP
jgi:hypothetical protein